MGIRCRKEMILEDVLGAKNLMKVKDGKYREVNAFKNVQKGIMKNRTDFALSVMIPV